MERYEPRPIRFLGLWRPDGWRIKVYGITYGGSVPRPALVRASKRMARARLADEAAMTRHYGVGFLGVHQGRDADVAFIAWWADENELHHHLCLGPSDQPERLRPRRKGDLMACVWDLEVLAFEREAWIESVMKHPEAPRWDEYLDTVIAGG